MNFLSNSLTTVVIGTVLAGTLAMSSVHAAETHPEVFENFWMEAKENSYPVSRSQTFFTNKNYVKLKKLAAKSKSLEELSIVLNKFLLNLNVSHTKFYTSKDIDFYTLRSLFSTKDIKTPKVSHIGAQYLNINGKYTIREVLEGYPANKAGLTRGDRIVEADNIKFTPYAAFNSGKDVVNLLVSRNGKTIKVKVNPIFESPHYSFLNAMKNSIKIYKLNGKKVAYIHLWSGTSKDILKEFQKIIQNEFLAMDGIILDLRGGFGGAWYDYLDPFFENRSDFFNFTWIDRNGTSKTHSPGERSINWFYPGKMVVLINEGVRSGKESLAYQFKKSKRATLIGKNTWGAFTAGLSIFNDINLNYFLYLATAELLLDGSTVEGIGISPDIKIDYPVDKSVEKDPQLKRAIEEIGKII